MLWMYQRVMYGEITHEENRHLSDLSEREIALLVPVVLMIVWIGVYPIHVSASYGRLNSPSPRADAGAENHGGATL